MKNNLRKPQPKITIVRPERRVQNKPKGVNPDPDPPILPHEGDIPFQFERERQIVNAALESNKRLKREKENDKAEDSQSDALVSMPWVTRLSLLPRKYRLSIRHNRAEAVGCAFAFICLFCLRLRTSLETLTAFRHVSSSRIGETFRFAVSTG